MSQLEAKKARLREMLSKIPPSVAGACSIQFAMQYKKDAASCYKVLNSSVSNEKKISDAVASMQRYWQQH